MFSLVRFIGRRFFSSQKTKRRWLSRTVTVIAVLRYIGNKTSRPQRIVLRRNEKLEITMYRSKESTQ